MRIKLWIDLAMTILFIVLMAFRTSENIVHEIIGVALLVLIIVHIIQNPRWLISIFKGNYSVLRAYKTTIILLTLLIFLILAVNAVFISRNVFEFFHLDGSLLVRKIHVFCASWSLILISMHLGCQWNSIAVILKKTFRFVTFSQHLLLAKEVAAVAFIMLGIQSFVQRNIAAKLVMYYTYDSFYPDESTLNILTDYIKIIAMFTILSFYITKALQKQWLKNKSEIEISIN